MFSWVVATAFGPPVVDRVGLLGLRPPVAGQSGGRVPEARSRGTRLWRELQASGERPVLPGLLELRNRPLVPPLGRGPAAPTRGGGGRSVEEDESGLVTA